MGEGTEVRLRPWAFVASLVVIVALVAAQSARPPRRRAPVSTGSERSSTSIGATGCPTSSRRSRSARRRGRRGAPRPLGERRPRRCEACAAGGTASRLLTLADVLHDGATSLVGGRLVRDRPRASPTGALLVIVGARIRPAATRDTRRRRGWFSSPPSWSMGSTVLDQWFERARGDPIAEYQIVAKEGLELLGWSLVALALWDEALCRRRALTAARARASRARAPSRRHAA